MAVQLVSKQDVCRFYREDFWGELGRRYCVRSRLAYFLFGRPRYKQFRTSRFEVLRLDTRRYQRRRRLTRSQIRFLNMEKARLYFLDLGYHALRHMLMGQSRTGRHPRGRWSDRFVTFRDQLTLRFDHLVFLSGLAQSLGQARRFVEKGFFKINNAYIVQNWRAVPMAGDEITVRRPIFRFMLRHLRRQRYHRRRNIFAHYRQRRYHYLWSRHRRRWRSLRPRRLIRRGVFRVLNVRRAYRRYLKTKSNRRYYLRGLGRWRKIRAPHSVALEAFMGPSLSRVLIRVLRGVRLLPKLSDQTAYKAYTNRFAMTRFILTSIRTRLTIIAKKVRSFRHQPFRLGKTLRKFFSRRLKFRGFLPTSLRSLDFQLGLLESNVSQLSNWCESLRTGFISPRLSHVRRLLWLHRQRRRSRLFLAAQIRLVSKAKPEKRLPLVKLTKRWKKRFGYLDNLARIRFLRSIGKLAPIAPPVKRKGVLPPKTLHARFYPGSWPNRPGYRPKGKNGSFSTDLGLRPAEPLLSALARLKPKFFRNASKKSKFSLVSKSNIDLARIAWLGQPASLITGRPLYISKQHNLLNSSFRSRLPLGLSHDVFGKDEVLHLSSKLEPHLTTKFKPKLSIQPHHQKATPKQYNGSQLPRFTNKQQPFALTASPKVSVKAQSFVNDPRYKQKAVKSSFSYQQPSAVVSSSKDSNSGFKARWRPTRPSAPLLANWFRVLPVPKSRLFIRARLDNSLLQSQFAITTNSVGRSTTILTLALTILQRLHHIEKSLISLSIPDQTLVKEVNSSASFTVATAINVQRDLIAALIQSRSSQFQFAFKDTPMILRRRSRPLARTIFKLQRRARHRRLNTLVLRRFPRFLVSYGLLRFFYLGNRQRRRRREWSHYYFACKFNVRSFITFYGGRRKLKPIDKDLDVYVVPPRRSFNRFYQERKPVLIRGTKV
jgi:ribosomal protein S4